MIILDDSPKAVELLSVELWQITRSDKKIKHIVAATGLCHSTIRRIMYKETRYPRFTTIVTLFNYFGYQLAVRPPEGDKKVVTFNPRKTKRYRVGAG